MPITENPMHLDDRADTGLQTHSEKNMNPAKAMVLKLSHPPCNVPELEGLPTNDARTQVITQWRNNDVLMDCTVNTGPGVTKTTGWTDVHDYGLIFPTGARISYIGCYYGQSARYLQDVANTKIQDNFDFSVWQKTVNLYRPIYKSATVYSNQTMFNNTGTCNVQQFNPAILFAGKLSTFSWQQPENFAKFVEDAVNDGRCTLGGSLHSDFNQSAVEHYFRKASIKFTGISLDPSTTIQVINLGKIGYNSDEASIMPSPSQMLTNSMRSYAGKAVDGAFAVQRLNTVTPAWLAGSRTSDDFNGLYECYTFTQYTNGPGSFTRLVEQAGIDKANVMLDTLWSQDMTWTFMRFQGLNPSGLISSSTVSPVVIKTYYGFEAQPVWGGPWNGLSRVSPKPDLAAMQALMDTFYGMPDAMEAKYNFLGTILPFLKGLIPKGISLLSGLFGGSSKSKAPDRYRNAGSTMADVVSTMRGMRMQEPMHYPPQQRHYDGQIYSTAPVTIAGPPAYPLPRAPAPRPSRSRTPRSQKRVVSASPAPRRNLKKLPPVPQGNKTYPKGYTRK